MSSSDSPSKTSGQFHSTKGTVTEMIGNVVGSANLQQSGKQEHIAGESEYNAARAKGYSEGTQERVIGKKDQVVGAVTGDKSQETEGNIRRDKGEAQQDINRKI